MHMGKKNYLKKNIFRKVRVAYLLLLLCMYYISDFVVFVCFACLVFVPGSHSFDFRKNPGSLDYYL